MRKRLPFAETAIMLNTNDFSQSYAIRVRKGGKPVYVVSDGKLLEFSNLAEAEAKADEITKRLRKAAES